MAHILAFAGSSRRGSFNRQLLEAAVAMLRSQQHTVSVLDLAELDLPLFHQDLEAEQGLPAGALRFQEALLAHDALLVATPEYNSGYTALLKNSIDWASRPSPSSPMLAGFRGKTALLLSASPGGMAGIRSLTATRDLLMNIGVQVLPQMVGIGNVRPESFTQDGSLQAAADAQRLLSAVEAFARALAPIAE